MLPDMGSCGLIDDLGVRSVLFNRPMASLAGACNTPLTGSSATALGDVMGEGFLVAITCIFTLGEGLAFLILRLPAIFSA